MAFEGYQVGTPGENGVGNGNGDELHGSQGELPRLQSWEAITGLRR